MNFNKISVIGSGGHARAVIALLNDVAIIPNAFYGENIFANEIILGVKGLDIKLLPDDSQIILAIGDNYEREVLNTKYKNRIYQHLIFHPTAFIHNTVKIEKSTLVFSGTSINALSRIGENCIINTKSIIEHETIIGNNCHISIGSIIAGRVKIGNNCFVGAGAIIKDKIQICDNVVIGAGSVVVKDIIHPGTYVGMPSKKIK